MTEASHEVKIANALAEPDTKGNLAKGKGIIEAVIRERKSAIPSETPGKDIIIKPRSPYREHKIDNWNRGSSDKSSEDSLHINNEMNVRSVYNIGSLKETMFNHDSPNRPTASFGNLPFSNPHYHGGHNVGIASLSGSTPNTLSRTPNSNGPIINHNNTSNVLPSMPLNQMMPSSHLLHSGTTHHHGHFSGVSPQQYYHPQGINSSAIMSMPQTTAAHSAAQYDSYLASQFPFGNTENKIKLPPGFIPNYDSYPEHLQKEARLHFASLFSDMKIKYKDRGEDFSEYDPSLPLRYIHQTSNAYKKKFAAESCSPIVKLMFMGIFFGLDVISHKYVNTELGNFAKSQVERMKSYEGMITEISNAFTGDGNEDWPVGFRLGFLLLFQILLFAGITFACAKLGIGNPQYWINFVNGYIGNSVDEVVAKKEPLPVDPLTNTTEIPKSDPVRNLMGNTEALLAMAGQTLKPGTDVVDAVGNFAASMMQRNGAKPKSNVKFGNKK
jgi:hypothetical protein